MTTLLVGFDSAWTANNFGGLVGVLRANDGGLRELGDPQVVNYGQAERAILKWQEHENPTATIVLLDQPTIVTNDTGQRPVENIVASPVTRRYGGVQPANTARIGMFCRNAPVWRFLEQFGGPANPFEPLGGTRVIETYPVLAMIALGWTLPDQRPTGRLPKYNPHRRMTFSPSDWKHVCQKASHELSARKLPKLEKWLNAIAESCSPRKKDQDCLDACLCLLVALYLAEEKECLMVGNMDTGYIVVPSSRELHKELQARCERTGRAHAEWVQVLPQAVQQQHLADGAARRHSC